MKPPFISSFFNSLFFLSFSAFSLLPNIGFGRVMITSNDAFYDVLGDGVESNAYTWDKITDNNGTGRKKFQTQATVPGSGLWLRYDQTVGQWEVAIADSDASGFVYAWNEEDSYPNSPDETLGTWRVNSAGLGGPPTSTNCTPIDFEGEVQNTVAGSAPEILVEDSDGTEIVNGDNTPSSAESTDFGVVNVNGGSVTRTFTIQNTGTAALTLTGPNPVSVSGSSAFTFTQPLSLSIPAAGSTTFTVTFDPPNNACSGPLSATVSIANNDSNENPYTFDVQGTPFDNVAPTASCQNLTVCLDPNGNANVSASQVNNVSSDNCGTPGLTVSPSSFSCSNISGNQVTLTATDVAGNSSTCTATAMVNDCTAPTLSLIGPNPIVICPGGALIDPGATINDNCGSGTVQGNTSGVDINTPGTYSITYNYTDAGWNPATQISRTIIVAVPSVGNQTTSIMSGMALNINLQDILDNEGNGVASTFSWSAANNPNVSGESMGIQNTNTITDQLDLNVINGADQIVQYTVTPTSTDGNCPGASFTIAVTVTGVPPINFNVSDPCGCADPQNVEVNGIFLFHDVLTVTSNPDIPIVILAPNDGEFRDEFDNLISLPVTMDQTAPGSGVYEFDFWHRRGESTTISVRANNDPLTDEVFTSSLCNNICIGTESIPTMGQWAYLLFGLIVFGVFLVGVYNLDWKIRLP